MKIYNTEDDHKDHVPNLYMYMVKIMVESGFFFQKRYNC